MANEITIDAELRNEFGKGASRRIRRAGKVPAVLYGHGTDPVHLSLPAHDMQLALRTSNALLVLSVGDTKQMALPKQVQRDPIRGSLEHVDLVLVSRGEKVTVEVPLVIVGELAEADLVLNVEALHLPLDVEATHIPEQIEVNVAELGLGDKITVAELALPEGSVFHGDAASFVVVSVAAPKAEEAPEGESAGASEGAEASE